MSVNSNSGYSVQILNDTTESIPHTFLMIHGPNGYVQGWGFYPNQHGVPIAPGQLKDNTDHRWNKGTDPIALNIDQYNNLLNYITESISNPPIYNISNGSDCTAWALQGLSVAGIFPHLVDLQNSPIQLALPSIFQTVYYNPWTLGDVLGVPRVAGNISQDLSSASLYGGNFLRDFLSTYTESTVYNYGDGSFFQINPVKSGDSSVVFYDPYGNRAANINFLLNSDGTSMCVVDNFEEYIWKSQIIISDSFGLPRTSTQYGADGSVLITAYDGTQGAYSIASIDRENIDGTSQITTFNPDGSSITSSYSGPDGTGKITEVDNENADGTSAITKYDSSGGSVVTHYAGPNGSGSPVMSQVTILSAPFLNSQTGLYDTTTATIELSPVSVRFQSIRQYSFFLETIPITVSLTGSSYHTPLTFTNVNIGQAPNRSDFPFNSGVASVADLVPNALTSSLAISSVEHSVPGDYENIKIGVNAIYNGGEVDFSVLGSQKIYGPARVGVQFQGASTNFVSLGVFHVGEISAAIPITVQNTADTPLNDDLVGNGGVLGPLTASTMPAVAAGSSGNIDVSVSSDTAGTYTYSTYSLFNLASHDSDLPDIPAQTNTNQFEISATINNYATADLYSISQFADHTVRHSENNALDIDFGTVPHGSFTGELVIGINNIAPAHTSDWIQVTVESDGFQFIQIPLSQFLLNAGDSHPFVYVTPYTKNYGFNKQVITLHLLDQNDSGYSSAMPDQTFTITDYVACFRAGTLIAAVDGDVPVEQLKVGDRVRATFAGDALVTWVGYRRIDCRRHPKPESVWPVHVSAGAFGDASPRRDLWLSPDHAAYIDGVLIPIRYLVNGTTIAEERVDEVTYYHVELSAHDVVLAEGLPCESYLDTGNRAAFENGGNAVALHPDFALGIWETKACASLVCDGVELEAARSWLLERARLLGFLTTRDAALHVIVGGHLVRPEVRGRMHRFLLPPMRGDVRLKSRKAVPAEAQADSSDHRSLGVAISRILLDGVPIGLGDVRLISGWHEVEGHAAGNVWRWTNGDAGLALMGGRTLDLEIAMTARYWLEQDVEGNEPPAFDSGQAA